MNLLENYIKHIYSTEDVYPILSDKKKHHIVVVDIDIVCYGSMKRIRRNFFEQEWETAKKNGYYMA